MMKKSKVSTFADIVLVLIFVGLIWFIPTGSIYSRNASSDLGEKRKLAACPDFKTDSIENIPEKYPESKTESRSDAGSVTHRWRFLSECRHALPIVPTPCRSASVRP